MISALKSSKSVTLLVDVSPASSLKWKEEEAKGVIEKGYSIVWELEIGLPLVDETAFLSVELGIDHFNKTLLSSYQKNSAGVILYRGTLSDAYRERESLKQLNACLPDSLPSFLVLDATSIKSPARFFQLSSKEHFPHCVLDLTSSFSSSDRAPLALLLPTEGDIQEFDGVIEKLKFPFRVIPERFLTQEWEGLDECIVFSHWVTPQGKRKLLGFCAAGGRVITVGQPLNLPREIPFDTWLYHFPEITLEAL